MLGHVLGPDSGKQLRTFARMGAVGIELALSIIIGVFAGRWLDRKVDTEPLFTIVGLILGVAAGFKSLYQTAKRQQQKASQETDDE